MKLRSIFAVMLLAVMLTGCAVNKSETKEKTYEHVQFASKVAAIEKQKEIITQSIEEAETLFNSRMDYYFN